MPGGSDNAGFTIENTYPSAFGSGKDLRYIFRGGRRKDRGALTGGPFVHQSALLEDYWGTRGTIGSTTVVSPFDLELYLPSGEYALTTYHHDIVAGTTGTLVITDATGTHGPLAVVESFGAAPIEIGMVMTTITSDGNNMVLLRFTPAVSTGSTEFGINGFVLEEILAIPEPSGVIAWLAAAAFACVGAALQRRRYV